MNQFVSHCVTSVCSAYRTNESSRASTLETFSLTVVILIVSFFLYSAVFGPSAGLYFGSSSYGIAAHTMLTRDIASLETYRPPLYPAILSVFMYYFEDAWRISAVYFQAALLMGLFIVIRALVKRLGGSAWTQSVALLLIASHALFIHESLVERETILSAFLIALFFYVATALQTSTTRAIYLGLTTGLIALTRPTGILFIIPLIILHLIERKTSLAVRLKLAAISAVVAIIVVTPWQLVIYKTTGTVTVFSSSTAGINLVKGNNPYFEKLFPAYDIDIYEKVLRDKHPGLALTDNEANATLQDEAKTFMLQNPIVTAYRSIKKVFYFFSPIPIPRIVGKMERDKTGYTVKAIHSRPMLLIVGTTLHAMLIYIGCFLAFRWSKNEKIKKLFILFCTAIVPMVALHAITFPETRFRLPFEPILILFAAYGFELLRKRYFSKGE